MGKRTKKKNHRPLAGATPAGATGLVIERVAVSKINPAPYNPRKELRPKDPEYQRLKNSLDRWGLVDPLIWNKRTGHLVGGHQRLRVLIAEQDIKTVDVSVVDLPAAEEKALNIALNKIAGEWDDEKLAAMLGELKALEDFDETLTGFDDEEIDDLLDEFATDGGEGEPEAVTAHSFKVIVECKSAAQQAQIVKLLTKRGVACHTRTAE